MKKSGRLLSFLTCAVMMIPTAGSLQCAAAANTDAQSLKDSVEIFCSLCNDARVAQGMQELYIAPVLVDYAQKRAEELPRVFGHTRPNGEKCFSIMKNDGFFYNTAAENVAAGGYDAEKTFLQFMASESHRKNILSESMTHIGTGFCYDETAEPEPDHICYQYYWSMFLIGTYDMHDTPVFYEGQYIPDRDPGDADGNKTVNAGDAARIMQYSAQRSAGTNPKVTDQFLAAADVNGDGAVNAIDAQIVLSYSTAAGADPNAVLSDFVW